VRYLSDQTLSRLCAVVDLPDLTGTRYRILEKVASGGMGTVYLAHDATLDREVALKVANGPDPGGDLAARMEREARIVASLEHPGIVPIHDRGVLPDGRAFCVMKFVRGQRLDVHISGIDLLPDRLRIMLKVCEAVSFAHAHGVLHRDLKPANIMVGSHGEVLVMDWGVAKTLREKATGDSGADTWANGGTGFGSVLGTRGYMAPEQTRGELDTLDERADVYSLGAIMYSILTLRTPPQTISAAPSPAERPSRINPAISKPLEAICLKALAWSREERYPSAEELARDISRFLGAEPVLAYPEPIVERILRLASKHRVPLILVLAYLLMRISLILFFKT
jgi:serine/threonine protein kinase